MLESLAVRRSVVMAAAALLVLLSVTRSAAAGAFEFRSIHSSPTSLPAFAATPPSLNGAGTVAFAALMLDAAANRSVWIVFKANGLGPVPLLDLTDALGPGSASSVVINDAGVVAVHYAAGPVASIVRINVDGTFAVMASADPLGAGPYLALAAALSMNAAGQVAALVTNGDSTSSVVRFEDSGAVEIARSAATLVNLSTPTINDAGVVAFTAQLAPGGPLHVHSGSGGPLTDEGAVDPCPGPSAFSPVINSSGFVLSDCGLPPLFLARGGTTGIVLLGSEDPIFARLASSYSLNNQGRPAFVTGLAAAPAAAGLFVGNNPLGAVVRTGDVVFGLAVEDLRMGSRAINDAGQIAFLLQAGAGDGAMSHVVLATPGRLPQTIDFPPLANRTVGEPPFDVTATASSGLPLTFAATGTCSITGRTVTVLGADFCIITASQGGNETYLAAPDVSQTFTIEHGSQTITFESPADRTFGDPPFAIFATASSGLPVTFAAAGSCALAGNVVTIVGGGSCTVTAAQGGNAAYAPAPAVTRTFAIGRASQSISFAPLSDRTLGEPPFTVAATASSGLPVRFSATGECTIDGDTLRLTAAGGCSVTASQPGDDNYGPAPDVVQTFAIDRTGQVITFGPLPKRGLGDVPFAVSAVASSGLLVSFRAEGTCSVVAEVVTVTGTGACTITASQAGNAQFGPAPDVAQSFPVSAVILEAHFDAGPDGFSYVDDPFRATSQPAYASGAWSAASGFRGGALTVTLGGLDDNTILGMSGGWTTTFNLNGPAKVMLYLRVGLTQSPFYESDETSQVLVSLDGALVGASPNDYLAQVVGDGNTGPEIKTGWRLYSVNLGTLGAGTHSLTIGGYNSRKNVANESTTIVIDDVVVMETATGARAAVSTLNFDRFKDNIRVLAGFGDRTQGAPSNIAAGNWLQQQLQAAGYKVERHPYTYGGQPRDQIYVTKVGTIFPDHMYIVSAHMDGRGGGGAANDDASGCALVLEAARGVANLKTAVSIRFVFWNNEETGLNGSTAYVNQRAGLQGVETPPGSGIYPEPRWLGMIQHDQILFDHGLPPQPNQIPAADLDVEYQATSTYASQALRLANALRAGNQTYSTDYPAQVGSNMNYTDSVPFQNYTAAVSVRDNQRIAEIGQGSNPHWHQPTDLYTAFSEQDFRLGFNAVQMTLGTISELSGATPR